MELASVRDLKLQLQQELVRQQPVVAYQEVQVSAAAGRRRTLYTGLKTFERGLRLSRRERALSLPALTPALGVARVGDAKFALAVRVQEPTGVDALVQYFESAAHGEVDVRVVRRAVSYRIDPRGRHRPIPSGVSIGHPAAQAGTLCCFVRTAADQVEVLSANHVIAAANAGRQGDPVIQPGPFDQGTVANDRIGQLTTVVPLVLGQPNLADAALCSLDDGIEAEIPAGLVVADSSAVASISDVTKRGRTTGKTTGAVSVFELDGVNIDVPGLGIVEYDGLVEVEARAKPFSLPGDSGALVTDRAERSCVAMVIGGDGDQLTWCTPLETVLGILGVSLMG